MNDDERNIMSFSYKGSYRFWDPRYLGLNNHLVYVIDMSGSMRHLRKAVAEFLEAQRKMHAAKSEENGQETRMTVYLFDNDVECVVFDRDVLRPIDFDAILQTNGATALRDATLLALSELAQTATTHGDHAFWLMAVTDGWENASRSYTVDLQNRISRLPNNWTVTCFVPGQTYVESAVNKAGFPREMVQTWDASERGVQQLDVTLTGAADTYYGGRAAGTKSFTSAALFGEGIDNKVISQALSDDDLVEVPPSTFAVFTLSERIEAKPFCEQNGYEYRTGAVFYEWFKTEDVQANKVVLVQRIRDGKVFTGEAGSGRVRQLLGLLPGMTNRGKPARNEHYRFFVQSTAPNRALIPGKHALIKDARKMATAR